MGQPAVVEAVRSLSLREYETTRGIYLSPEDCDALRLLIPDLTVSPTVGEPGRFDLTPASTVGVAAVGELAVSIRPKVSIQRLLFLVSYALDPRAWRSTNAGFIESESVVEAIVPGFVRQVRAALAGGALHGYRSEEDALFTVRGRIRFGEQIRRRFGHRLPVEVSFDEFTVDVEANRVIKAAIHRLGKMRIRSEDARRSLRAFDGQLEGVSLVDYDRRSLPRFTWTRLNRHYRSAVELALLILATSSVEALPGGRQSSALLLDMNKVFENFVVVALREALGVGPSELVQHGAGSGLALDVAGQIRLRPDLSWWEETRCLFVGDVKYKRLSAAGIVNADLYQLLAYLTATDLDAGVLIYAEGEADVAEHLVIGQGTRLLVRTLNVDGSPEAVLAEAGLLAEVVRALAHPGEPIAAAG